jgi:hypothetical protein
MAGQTRTTFKKRQKEMARMEKQRDKAAKRLQRKLGEKPAEESEILLDENGMPVLVDESGVPVEASRSADTKSPVRRCSSARSLSVSATKGWSSPPRPRVSPWPTSISISPIEKS